MLNSARLRTGGFRFGAAMRALTALAVTLLVAPACGESVDPGSAAAPLTRHVQQADAVTPPALLGSIAIEDITQNSAVLVFATDEPAAVYVLYDLSRWQKTLRVPELQTEHRVRLDRLLSAENHRVIVTLRDEFGNETTLDEVAFRTPSWSDDDAEAGWQSQDIGRVSVTKPRSARYDATANVWSVEATGTDV